MREGKRRLGVIARHKRCRRKEWKKETEKVVNRSDGRC